MSESDEQRAYREERTDELIWERSRALGMSRKRFLEVLASGAGAAAALGLSATANRAGAQGHQSHFNQYPNWFVKPTPPEYFLDHGHAKEMRWEVMKGRGYTVPNDLFFLQTHFPVPRIDPAAYRLRVHGDAVERDVEFSLDDLKKLPSVTLPRAIECGENGRVFFAIHPPPPPFPGVVATWQNVKSSFELPWNTTLPAGPQVISGRSWSGRSNIRKVDVSLDGGRTWQAARLREPNVEKAWVRWDVDWTATPGNYVFRARATDGRGDTQPDAGPKYNFHGYLYDGVVDHPVWVF